MGVTLKVILPVFVKQARQHWVYIALIVMSLLVASAGLSSIFLISSAAVQGLQSDEQSLAFMVSPSEDSPLTLDDYAAIRKQGFIDTVAYDQYATKIKDQDALVIGFDGFAMLNSQLIQAMQAGKSSAVVTTNGLLITHKDAQKLSLQDGQRLQIADRTLTIRVVDSSFAGKLQRRRTPTLFANLPDLYRLFPQAKSDGIEGIAVLFDKTSDELAAMRAWLPNNASIQTSVSDDDKQRMGSSFSFHLMAMAGLMAVVCFFIVTNALNMLLSYRLDILQNLHRLGIAKRHTLIALLTELFSLCIFASLVGTVLGIITTVWFAQAVEGALSAILRSNALISDIPLWWVAILSIGMSVVGMLLALIPPVRKIYTLSDTGKNSLSPQLPVMAGSVLLALSYLFFQLKNKSGDLGGLAFFLLGFSIWVSSLTPMLFKALSQIISKRFTLAHWSVSSGSDLAKKCRLSASAYFIALSAAIGLSTMVESFRSATDSWLSQRLAAPAYLYINDATQFDDFVEAASIAIERQASQADITVRYTGTAKLDGEATLLSVYPDSQTYQEAMVFEQSIPSVWPSFSSGTGVFINQQLAFRRNISLGDTVTLSTADSSETVTIAGIYYDYGNPDSHIMVSPVVKRLTQNVHSTVALNASMDKIDWQQVTNDLLAVYPEAQVYLRGDLLELSMQTFDNTFVLTDLLSVVALLVAALSFAMTIALLARHLDRQVNTLQTLGMKLSHVRNAIILQFCLMCAFVTALAIPVGLVCAHLLISTVNINAFGWTYPLTINPPSVLFTAGTGFVLMCCVCVLSYWHRHIKLNQIRYTVSSVLVPAMLLSLTMLAGCSKPENDSMFAGFSDSQSNDDLAQYKKVDPSRGVSLPADHQSHLDYQIEWWYLTVVFEDESQNTYPFQYTLFRFNQQGQQRYMAHASLHSAQQHWFEERFAQPELPTFSFSTTPFSMSVDNWQWQGTGNTPFPADLQVKWWQGPAMQLTITPDQNYIKQGVDGVSTKSANGNHVSYYYSHPFLTAQAKLMLEDGTTKTLSGKGWYDHEWTSQLVRDEVEGWDWFSLHLDSGDKLMVFRMRIADQADFFTGTWINANGTSYTLPAEAFSLAPKSGQDRLPLNWTLDYAEKNMAIEIAPFKAKQWNCGLLNYYEGAVTLSGSHSGKGFMELTGYPRPQSACE